MKRWPSIRFFIPPSPVFAVALDLHAHDRLLEVLGPTAEQVHLTPWLQRERPVDHDILLILEGHKFLVGATFLLGDVRFAAKPKQRVCQHSLRESCIFEEPRWTLHAGMI